MPEAYIMRAPAGQSSLHLHAVRVRNRGIASSLTFVLLAGRLYAGVAGSMVSCEMLARGMAAREVRAAGMPHAPQADAAEQTRGMHYAEAKGLRAEDWAGIRAAYEAHRHAAVPSRGGYVARNAGQQWRTQFDGRGFTVTPDGGGWSWGLELVGYGRGDAVVRVSDRRNAANAGAAGLPACSEAAGPRVAYEWDDTLTEWYVNDARGLEHGFTIQSRPQSNQNPDREGGVSSRPLLGESPFAPELQEPLVRESSLAPDLRESLPAPAPLHLTLAIRGGLLPRISPDGRDVAFVNPSGAAVINYSGLTVLDADGRSLPAYFEASGNALRLTIDDAGARYPITVDPIAQQAYLKASNTGAGDDFGYSVAISGGTVVVGAPGEDSNATGVNGDQADNSAPYAGAAYVFVRSGTTWTQQAYLKASNTDSGDYFGVSVAISGDTVVVGAFWEESSATGVDGNQADNSASGSGAAYVFVRNGTSWSQQAYFKASNTGVGDYFGGSVAISGDTVVIGAEYEDSRATGVNGNQNDNSFTDSGAAYVFVRGATAWSQQAYLKASNTGTLDHFGHRVAIWADTVVVGAQWEDSSATGVNGNQADNSASASGAAYVFVRNGTSWSQQAYLKASNTGAADYFGSNVDISDDTVVVAAFGEASSATGVNGNQADNSAPSAGAEYVFIRSGSSWSQQAYLKASNTDAGDEFGTGVGISGDTVVVGARKEDSNATGVNGNQGDNSALDSGAVYIFVRDGGMWRQQAYLKASNTDIGDEFGDGVAISGDTVVVGARKEDSNATGVNGNQADNGASRAGAAYIFTGVGPPPCVPCDANCNGSVNQFDIQAFIDTLISHSGCSPCAGDANGDGTTNQFDIAGFIDCLLP